MNIPVTTVGGREIETVRGSVVLRLHSKHTRALLEVQALILRHLTMRTPQKKTVRSNWLHLQGINLADPEFTIPQNIEILLGADIYGSLLLDGLRRSHRDAPIAQNTIFGWIVLGPARDSSLFPQELVVGSLATITTALNDQQDDLCNNLEHFWNQEEVTLRPLLSQEEHECERQFQDCVRRDHTGKYVVRLPIRSSCNFQLGESLSIAMRVLKSMLLRMDKDPLLCKEYTYFMQEYERLGHMRPIPTSQLNPPRSLYYIPHHAIWQKTDGRPKLRVVFNASRSSSTGLAVNQLVYTGPKLQVSLSTVLLRWRLLRVVFVADIEMMYRQVLVDERDVDLQRIVWKRPEDDQVTHFQLLTLTYGMSCSPYLALRTVQQLASDEETTYPDAARILRENTYVDDILSGADSESTAIQYRDQLISILSTAGLHLRKWVSNHPQLLKDIPESDRLRPDWKHFETDGPTNALGVAWDPVRDEFRFKPPTMELLNEATKRSVLSAIARLFDPVGWLSQIIIIAKVLMQDLWRAKLDWDASLPVPLSQRWLAFKNQLTDVSSISCPRWLGNQPHHSYEIHGFGDASKTAYAATAYIRIQTPNQVVCRLLTAKTRVAPVKTLTIPRLELCAAVLVNRLVTSVLDDLGLSPCPIYIWSDSQNVLHWINTTDPSRWPTFVANRVSEIQRTLPDASWRYVPTSDNPADIATRGLEARSLAGLKLWWEGPDWLAMDNSKWPHISHITNIPPNAADADPPPPLISTALIQTCPGFFTRYSSLTRLTRVIARCLRWKLLLRPLAERVASFQQCLQPKEMRQAFLCCVHWTQQSHFQDYMRILRQGGMLPKRSPLASLHPFIDAAGILRVGGRLANSTLPYDQKHPVVLPGLSVLADLIIDWAHKTSIHGGFQLTYSHTIWRAWIIRGRVRIKRHLRNCVICVRTRIQKAGQLMGQLPTERVIAARPFQRSGIDYAGPFVLKATKGRGFRTVKGYIALFVCLCTKAVHLEVVGDLTTDSFIAALRRFISRRGVPSELWSDNATTFHGADVELRSMLREAQVNWTSIQDTLTNEGITWRFIPPSAPHFGGLWEAGVKAAKSHLKRIVGVRSLTYEEMTTLTAQIEMCMNSRPLVPIVGDPEDLDILTPGHALIGGPLIALPEPLDLEQIRDCDTHWRLIKKMRDNFCIRWSRDYLHTLQQRNKWRQPSANLKIGDMVMIADTSLLKANRWPIGRILEVYPGPDGLVRIAKVRTAIGTYDRPIRKLCPLPISQ